MTPEEAYRAGYQAGYHAGYQDGYQFLKLSMPEKEQEAVEPKKKSDGNPGRWASWWYVCGNCGEEIDWHDMYCRHCGREVKWNES